MDVVMIYKYGKRFRYAPSFNNQNTILKKSREIAVENMNSNYVHILEWLCPHCAVVLHTSFLCFSEKKLF